MNTEQLYQAYLEARTHCGAGTAVTTDSRKIIPGCIFFAFKGETFDGNAFVPQALEHGAALCVTSDPQYKMSTRTPGDRPNCLVVPDVLKTLQDLAAYHRNRLTIPFVGITGTNGKTTTKELVHAVLSRRYRTHATAGNFNNHLGVPLTLLSMPADTQIAIVEMGANHPGEIEALCRIADPDCGLITNVGRAHLEGFGSFEGVVHTKTELYRHLAAKQGLVFVNADNERLMHEAERLATIPATDSAIPAYAPATPILTPEAIAGTPLSLLTYGTCPEADVHGTYVESNPYVHFYFEVGDNVYNVRTHLLGAYNFDNCMAAVAVGLHFGVEPWDIKEAIEAYEPSNRRSQYKETGRNRLFLDCYNANPSSMKAALASFATLPYPNKVPMLGGMKELGRDSRKEHQAIVNMLQEGDYKQVILVGPEFDQTMSGDNLLWFSTAEEAVAYLHEHPLQDCTVLLKGSNSTHMWLLEAEL